MIRLAAALLLAALVGVPLAVLPSPPVTWFAIAALVMGVAGVVTLSVPLVTAGASVALIGYAIALAIVRPAVDPVAAIALGVALVLLPSLVHLAHHVRGAVVGPGVLSSQLRQWLAIVAAGIVAAVVLTAVAPALGSALQSAAFPVVVGAAVLGALMVVAGLIALVTTRKDPSARMAARRGFE